MTDKTLCDNCKEVVIEEMPSKWFNDLRPASQEDKKTLAVGDLMCDACAEYLFLTEVGASSND